MSFTGRAVPGEFGGGVRGPVAAFALRVLLAVGATAVVIGSGSFALLFETAPQAVSMVVEPLSLLLLPGLFYGIVRASSHALDSQEMMNASVVFYLCFFFLLFEYRAWSKRREARPQ